jgi:hypothetical protein
MVNHHRGEIDAMIDGKPYRLCLTLGALAELEAAFGDEDMLALAQRFSSGRLSARDAIRIIAAGLRGGGNDISDAVVARMQIENGAAGSVDIVARLLEATFDSGAQTASAKAESDTAAIPDDQNDREVAVSTSPLPDPFLGTT